MAGRLRVLLAALILVLLLAPGAAADKPEDRSGDRCATIQGGTILAIESTPEEPVTLMLGFDHWGYNYQAQMFSGPYNDATRSECTATWCPVVQAIRLTMKWNDAYMATKDCDGNRLLDMPTTDDTPYPDAEFIGSGAAFTNKISGEYEYDGQRCTWSHDLRIVARPESAELESDQWFVNGVEIGRKIQFTGDTVPSQVFMTVAESYSDPCGQVGEILTQVWEGVDYKSPVRPGNR